MNHQNHHSAHGLHRIFVGVNPLKPGGDGHIASVFPEWYQSVPDRWQQLIQKQLGPSFEHQRNGNMGRNMGFLVDFESYFR